jgi:hypothetical protein
MVRTTKDVILKKHSKTLIPVAVKKLPDDRDYRFQARYMPQTAHLSMHGNFPEAIMHVNSTLVAYCNTSESSILLPANTHIGEISKWDSDKRMMPEDPRVVDCLFAVSQAIPTLSQAVTLGLSAMQATQVCFHAGETYSPDLSTFMTEPSCSVDFQNIYSLFPPLDECGEPLSKFGPEAVHINTTDDITPEQVQRLRAVVAEFSEL